MKTQGKVWVIYDPEKKKQSKPMSIIQTQVVLLSMKKKDAARNFIWTPGWSEWVLIEEFMSSDQSYFTMSKPPSPAAKADNEEFTQTGITDTSSSKTSVAMTISETPYTHVVIDKPEQEADFGYYYKDFNGDELDLSKIRKIKASAAKTAAPASAKDKHADVLKIQVLLMTKKTSFRTHSLTISLSGAILADELPKEYLKEAFDLIITNPFEKDHKKSHLHFRAKIVGDFKSASRLVFIEQDVAMTEKLKSFLNEYLGHQDQFQKSTG